jgi:hypothetical protein
MPSRRATLLSAVLASSTLLSAPAGPAAAGVPVRIGDPGSVFDESKYDDRFPDSKEWAKAGVEGGIPLPSQLPVVSRIRPGEDIQAAVDAARQGVVVLAAGLHRTDRTVNMKNGVVLRGEDKDKTIIEYGVEDKDCRCLFMFRKVERAGVEDLTMRQARVFAMDPKVYEGKYENHAGFAHDDAATVEMVGASNCWAQNCNIVFSLSRPVRIHSGSAHVTMRDNYVDKCLHRGGQGSGYYEVVHATYVLMYNETVKNIRHVCLDGRIDYTVLVHCRLAVDVNWHCIPPMAKSLVERLDSEAEAVGHRWPTFCHYRERMAPDNLVYMSKPGWDDGNVYHPVHGGSPFIQKADLPQPKGGTLYPVTGIHASREEWEKVKRENSAEAVKAREEAKAREAAEVARREAEARRAALARVEGEYVARLDAQAKARVKSGAKVAFTMGAMGRVELTGVDAEGRFMASARGVTLRVTVDRLSAPDRYRLAAALAAKGDPESSALAAFFALAAGLAGPAGEHLREAGDLAGPVRALFER